MASSVRLYEDRRLCYNRNSEERLRDGDDRMTDETPRERIFVLQMIRKHVFACSERPADSVFA